MASTKDRKKATRKREEDNSLSNTPPEDYVPDRESVELVSKRASLLCIDLVESNSVCIPNIDIPDSTIMQSSLIQIDLQISEADSDNSSEFNVYCTFGLREIPEEEEDSDDPKLIFRVTAVFRLNYTVDEMTDIDEKDLLAFSVIVASRNAWPYWREFVQNITSRMSIAPVTMPLLPPANSGRFKGSIKKTR